MAPGSKNCCEDIEMRLLRQRVTGSLEAHSIGLPWEVCLRRWQIWDGIPTMRKNQAHKNPEENNTGRKHSKCKGPGVRTSLMGSKSKQRKGDRRGGWKGRNG